MAAAAAALLLSAAGCEDGEEPTGAGGSGNGGAGGTTDTGGGGAGGAGGSGGAGGGSAGECLPEAAYGALFALDAGDLCAVAVLTADTVVAYQQPTWGAHDGPLLVEPGPGAGQVTLARWSPPSGAQGAMTVAKTPLDAGIPDGVFVGAQALDLGFRPGTLVSYAGSFPDTAGELIVATDAGADERYPVNALFSVAAVPGASGGRLVHTSLSPLGDANAPANALYAADDCNGDFVPAGDPACAAPVLVAEWGDSSGPVVTDTQGNVLVLMSSFAGDQEARGFAAGAIAKGKGATEGDLLFTHPGFGLSLAAVAPTGDAPGIAAFQPSDTDTAAAQDVFHVRYSVTGDGLTVDGPPAKLLTLASPDTPVALLTDPQDRLWAGVGIKDDAGNVVSTTFVVLARKPR